MAGRPQGAVARQIRRLFAQGSIAGLSEWQLLDRYATRRDEAAFEALVAEYGPMVLGVCHRVLDDPHAIEDAFQATFLVLVRKASRLGPRDAIGHWLYGVACRVALRARCEAAQRRSREVSLERAEGMTVGDEPGGDELARILDEELARLPAKYRAPVVLCHLEGLTHEEAARQLAWPIGTVKGRLARAKDLLRGRLARRGLMPSAGLLAAVLSRDASAAIPAALRAVTIQAALRFSIGTAAAGVISAPAVQLSQGVLSAMALIKLKLTATVLGACGCLALGAWALGQPSPGSDPGLQDARAEAFPPSADEADKPVDEQAIRDTLAKPLKLKFRESRLIDLLKAIKVATRSPGTSGVPIYVEPEGLQEVGANLDAPVKIHRQGCPAPGRLGPGPAALEAGRHGAGGPARHHLAPGSGPHRAARLEQVASACQPGALGLDLGRAGRNREPEPRRMAQTDGRRPDQLLPRIR
jgi:RNA polymerase sigma factor (sigma-70 family)